MKTFYKKLQQSQRDRRVLVYNKRRISKNKLYAQISHDYNKHFKRIYDPETKKKHMQDLMFHLNTFGFVELEFSTPLSKTNFKVSIYEPVN